MTRLRLAGTAHRWPRWVAVVMLSFLLALPQHGLLTAAAGCLLAFCVGVGPGGVRRGGFALGLGLLLSGAGLVTGIVEWSGARQDLPFAVLRAAIAWLLGYAWQLRAHVRRAAVEQIVRERQEQVAAARHAHAQERITLAETLHDELGHALSLVALDLGRLELAPDLDPGVQHTIANARQSLSTAVERLGDSVSGLRATTRHTPEPPADALVLLQTVRRSGMDVRVPDPDALELLARESPTTVVRVLREGLTNATKHAPGQPVTITTHQQDGRAHLTITNPRPGTHSPPTSRAGLSILEQHLRSAGGALAYSAHPPGLFRMTAMLPPTTTRRTVAAGQPGHAAQRLNRRHDEVHETVTTIGRAQRRGNAILVGATTVVLLLLGCVELWATWNVHRTVLPPERFHQIHAGDPRDRVERRLPPRHLPSSPGLQGDEECHDYAVTASPFADAAGEVYRICFAGSVVSRARHLTGSDL